MNSDDDLANQSSGWVPADLPRITRFKFRVTYVTLAFGIVTQLFYKPVTTSLVVMEVAT